MFWPNTVKTPPIKTIKIAENQCFHPSTNSVGKIPQSALRNSWIFTFEKYMVESCNSMKILSISCAKNEDSKIGII